MKSILIKSLMVFGVCGFGIQSLAQTAADVKKAKAEVVKEPNAAAQVVTEKAAQAKTAVKKATVAQPVIMMAPAKPKPRPRVEKTMAKPAMKKMDHHHYHHSDSQTAVVNFNTEYGFDMLSPLTNVNSKQMLILKRKASGKLKPNAVYLSGSTTAIMNMQWSNRDGKFGYLMRHPTSANQVSQRVSEAVIHSAQVGFTANLGDWITTFGEMLYSPQQSFGAGSIVALGRNLVEMRRGYVLLGNLEKFPAYLTIGKMAVPFGLTDTVSPFTNNTVFHAFGAHAYGAKAVFDKYGINLRYMAIQGGQQFRATGTLVDGTNVPSQLNNTAVDLSYTLEFGAASHFKIGGSFLKGSNYCHDYPVFHFNPCVIDNGATSFYGQFVTTNFTFNAEYAETQDPWPGTFNPSLPQFEAKKVTSFGVGGQYRFMMMNQKSFVSAEFSRFIAGPEGSPWERQDQLVVGMATHLAPSVRFFVEYIKVNGFAPLNFISGGNVNGPGNVVDNTQTHSDRDVQVDVAMIGLHASF